MKKIVSLMLCALMLVQCMPLFTFAAEEEKEPMKILFIGNSATYYNDMPAAIFAPLCEAAGYDVEVTSITKGSYYLHRHINVNDAVGAQVHVALRDNKYDYVVMQDYVHATVPADYYTGVRIMTKMVRENGAVPVLYSVVPPLDGASTYDKDYGYGQDAKTFAHKSDSASTAIATELGIKVAHAGLAIYDLMENHPELTLHHTDNRHPGVLGSFVIASTIFATIFDHDPTKVDYIGSTDADTAAILKEAARKATFETPDIPAEYDMGTSVGVGTLPRDYGIDATKTVMLDAVPDAPIISVESDGTLYPNGLTYSGIRGTKGAVASSAYNATQLSDTQKADIADLGYGISVIGIEHMYKSSTYDWERSIENIIDGVWDAGLRSVGRMHFSDKRYTVDGVESADGKYRGLITLNFGAKKEFEAIGFLAHAITSIPGIVEVFVSDDGENWTLVPSASWNGIGETTFTDLGGCLKDYNAGDTAACTVLFSMEGACGQYIRLGIAEGRTTDFSAYSYINPLELVVFGEGAPDKGLRFTAEDNYTTTSAPAGIPRTIEAWVKVDKNAPDTRLGIIVGNYVSGTYKNTMLDLEIRTNGTPYLYWRAGTNKSVTANFTDVDLRTGAWTHVAVVSTATEAKCYINGELKQTVEVAMVDFDVSGLSQFMVGGDFRTDNTQYLKNTTLGAVSMYSESRTATQIAADYAATDFTDDALMLAYDFTESGMARLKDYSANGNHLGYSNTADSTLNESYVEMQTGMTFDNTNGVYEIGTLAAVPHTFEAEVYFPSTFASDERGGVIIGNYGSETECLNLEVHTNGRLRYYWQDAAGDAHAVYFNAGLYCGAWKHVAITYDDIVNTATCYVDGELLGTEVVDVTVPAPNSVKDYVLGGDRRSGNEQYFKGNLRSVAVYSDIRTDAEIAADAVAYGADDLILHYDLSAYTYTDRPDVVTDLAGNNNAVHKKVWLDNEEIETDYAYSFAVVGDTQCLNDFYPEHFQTLYDWIVANKETKNIQYVFGLGDITNRSLIREWDEAITGFDKLSDAGIPYSVVRGNHDSQTTTDATKLQFNVAMADSKYASEIPAEQRFKADELENTYRVFTVGEEKFVSITLDYGPTDEELAWASSVCEAYPDHKIIMTTHAYMFRDGTTLDKGDVVPPSNADPANNDGDEVFEKFVKQHENIVLVMSGHDPSTYIATRKDVGVHGNTITQMLVDAQTEEKNRGALGMVTMLYFSKDGRCVEVEHYSTVRDQYFYEDNQFTMTWNELAGDIDLDYTVDIKDVLTALAASLNGREESRADVNGDGAITLLDVLKILKYAVQ